jgi:hypothetical protein
MNTILFSTNKYLFKSYLLVEMLNRTEINDCLRDKLTLLMIDLSAILIQIKKEQSVYQVNLTEKKNREILKKLYFLLLNNNNTNDSNNTATDLTDLCRQIETNFDLIKKEEEEDNYNPSGYLNKIWNMFTFRKVIDKNNDENNNIKLSDKMRLSLLKLIENVSLNLIRELNIVDYGKIITDFKDEKCIQKLYNRIIRINDVIKKQENHHLNTSSSGLKRSASSSTCLLLIHEPSKKIKQSSSIELTKKYSMRLISINKMPGIGPTYSERLKNSNLEKFGDLVDFYEIKCRKNEQIFEQKLKEIASIKGNSVKKLLEAIQNYLKTIE